MLLVSYITLANQKCVEGTVARSGAKASDRYVFVTTHEQPVAVAEVTRGRGPWASVRGESTGGVHESYNYKRRK